MANTTRSRAAQKKQAEAQISSAADFKKRIGGVIELPSGLVVKWRNPGGLKAFMSSGKIPNMLLGVVQEALDGGKGAKDKAEQEVMAMIKDDPAAIAQMMELYDEVTLRAVKEPRIYPAPTEEDVIEWNRENPEDTLDDPEDLREDDKLYIDELVDDDKAYIFECVTSGVKDLETFRKERNIDVAAVAAVSNAQAGAKPVDGD